MTDPALCPGPLVNSHHHCLSGTHRCQALCENGLCVQHLSSLQLIKVEIENPISHEETEVQCVSPKLMSRKEQANTGVPSLCLGSP